MNPGDLHDLLRGVKAGLVSPEEAAERLRALPFEDLGFANIDHHRALRRGFPEVVYGAGKTPAQIVAIAERMTAAGHNVLVTRVASAVAETLRSAGLSAEHHESAACVTVTVRPTPPLEGRLAVVSAGTSDQPVAEEAAVTAAFFG